MIASVKQGVRLYGPTAIVDAFNSKRNYRYNLLIQLDDAMLIKDSVGIHLARMRISSAERDMVLQEQKLKLLMKNLADKHSSLYMDGDGVVWTSPPVEIG